MGLKTEEKRYKVLVKRVSHDQTGHFWSKGDIFVASAFDPAVIADWLKSGVIKEAE